MQSCCSLLIALALLAVALVLEYTSRDTWYWLFGYLVTLLKVYTHSAVHVNLSLSLATACPSLNGEPVLVFYFHVATAEQVLFLLLATSHFVTANSHFGQIVASTTHFSLYPYISFCTLPQNARKSSCCALCVYLLYLLLLLCVCVLRDGIHLH